ncbi:hypothetical protein Pmani_012922 [Petrolisthes manimaculis]|uniref:Uncharacterized protein n=1 Tax=Petrolisthes manimaculis TaxID=1843537 RepID=A0AAE1PWA1_9EUCA|nr:hypothetical protein Pmani_012922 [Petrolisthes manimaculis]
MINKGPEIVSVTKVDSEKDLGVLVDYDLNFRKDISSRANKANKIMGVIHRSFSYLDNENFSRLYKTLVRPHVKYAAPVWSPMYKKDFDILEGVQRRATISIPNKKMKTYEERLQTLKLPTLRFRRLLGDMIEVYKMTSGIYNTTTKCTILLTLIFKIRGNYRCLTKRHARTKLSQHFFSNHIVNPWNSPTQLIDYFFMQLGIW